MHYELIDDGFRNDIVDDSIEPLCEDIGPGEFCPHCCSQHCTSPNGHEWGENDYCRLCGADGRA